MDEKNDHDHGDGDEKKDTLQAHISIVTCLGVASVQITSEADRIPRISSPIRAHQFPPMLWQVGGRTAEPG
jgi:hypothetical protein